MIELNKQEAREMIVCLSSYVIYITARQANDSKTLLRSNYAAYCINTLMTNNTIYKVHQPAIDAIAREIKELDNNEDREKFLSSLMHKLEKTMDEEAKKVTGLVDVTYSDL